MRVQNPNNFDLGLTENRFETYLNDQEFGNGMFGAKVTVPRLRSEVFTGEVITSLGSFLRQAQGINTSTVKLRYHLNGTAFADSPGEFTIPFDERETMDLNFVRGPRSQTAIPGFYQVNRRNPPL